MKLTCPNCGAQYEVPDAVIPASGRDVQCSNCGTTWFQHHPDHPSAGDTAPEPEHAPGAAPAPEPEPEPEPEPAPAQASARRLDPSVADILREEAQRERAARAAEADGRIETQPDLGLTEPEPDQARRAREARDRMQRLRGGPAEEAAPPTGPETSPARDDPEEADDYFDDEDDDRRLETGSRRNLFPDIDEINSSLSASDGTTGALAPSLPRDMPAERRGGGFRTGFRLAVVASVAALVVYLMAPRIAGLWPAAEAPLAHYVAAVDGLRASLSALAADLIARL
jgi:predicted Zn finger-like uncharacterized protein